VVADLPSRPSSNRWLRRIAVFALIAVAASFLVAVTREPNARAAATAADRSALAEWWAPVHFQDVDTTGTTSLGGHSDYITSYDFDGDTNGRNNWENTDRYPLKATIYYSVVQTRAFTYLIYMFFHPRDWADQSADDPYEDDTEHENDSEGVLVIVANSDTDPHGTLKAAITVAHKNFYSYVPSGSDFTSGGETVDGVLPTKADYYGDQHARPWTAQQANTHAAWAANDLTRLRDEYDHGDGILYNYTGTAAVPSGTNDRRAQYSLTDIFAPGGMWDKHPTPPAYNDLFASNGHFAGDDSDNPYGAKCGEDAWQCETDAASPPWTWDDSDDVPGSGFLATHPAELVSAYFNWTNKADDFTYTWNPYLGVTPPDPTPSPTPTPDRGIKNVMIVGDSISNGFESDYTWRYRFWQWTRKENWAVNFVGPLTGTDKPEAPHGPVPPPLVGTNPTPPEPDPSTFTGVYASDVDSGFLSNGSAHYAMWGRQLGQDVATIGPVMNTLKSKGQLPDLLLVELGFNDIGWLFAGAGLVDTMKTFIDNARRANPNVRIVVGNVPHRTTLGPANPQLPQRTTEYNAVLASTIAAMSASGMPITLADIDGSYGCDPNATTCASTYDGLHPNALGEYRIAKAFGTAVHDKFHIGTSAPSVPSSVPTRVVATPSSLTFDGTQQGVTVTWPKVFGAHSYDVQWRDTTLDANASWVDGVPTSFNRFDLSWQFTNQPLDGHTYQVKVRSVAGDADSLKSAWSSPVSGTAHPTTAPPPATVTAGNIGPGAISVAWTPPPSSPHDASIVRFALWVYDTDTPLVWSRIYGYPPTTGTATITGLTSGHHYQVFMCSWNAAGEGKPGAVTTVVPL
jgi:lysophospholipase L1-like esterase